MSHTVGYKADGLESASFEPYGDCAEYAQVIIKDIPPHSAARFGFEKGVGTREVIWVQVETHHACGIHHFPDLMYMSCH